MSDEISREEIAALLASGSEEMTREPCEDCISRRAAIDAIRKDVMGGLNYEGILTRLPSVKPQEPKTGQWIPISDRLPKANEYDGHTWKYYLIQNEYGDMLVAHWDGEHWCQIYADDNVEDNVIAWMPLPEPYEPQESEETDEKLSS